MVNRRKGRKIREKQGREGKARRQKNKIKSEINKEISQPITCDYV
jgi:hypothetical protein